MLPAVYNMHRSTVFIGSKKFGLSLGLSAMPAKVGLLLVTIFAPLRCYTCHPSSHFLGSEASLFGFFPATSKLILKIELTVQIGPGYNFMN